MILTLPSRLKLLLQILITAVLYFVLARLSLFLQFQESHATPVWPSSGFAFAIMILWGYRMAPGILIGAFMANLLNFLHNQTADPVTSVWVSAIIGVGNTSEAWIGTYLLRQLFPNFSVSTFFDKVSDVFAFSLIAVLMCLVSSSIGSTTIYLLGFITTDQYPIVMGTWWLGDFAGILLVTTFIFIWLKSLKTFSPIGYSGWERKAEIIALYFSVVFASGIIFDGWFTSYPVFAWAYWIIPILVWAAIRFNQREIITSLAINSGIAIWGTINQRGPFGSLELNDALLSVQAFISIMVITKTTLNVSVLERRKTEKILRDTGSILELHVKNRTAQLEERNQYVETLNQDLQHMNEELSSFAYAASHDLQEPLRKIQVFSKRIIEIEQDSLSAKAKDYFDRMHNAAQRMQQLIENLLSYSRTINAERNFEITSLSHLLEEVKEELKEELHHHQAKIEADELCTININPFLFRQLFHNLISNSFKFSSPSRPLFIRISSQMTIGSLLPLSKPEQNKQYCHITYVDNGIGFEPGFNEQIFGLFQRLHSKTEYPGTGIGLAICKKIMDTHHGYITAQGHPGEGATFHIYIPAEGLA